MAQVLLGSAVAQVLFGNDTLDVAALRARLDDALPCTALDERPGDEMEFS